MFIIKSTRYIKFYERTRTEADIDTIYIRLCL